MDQLSSLHVIIPLIGAALCAFVRTGRTAWIVTVLSTLASFLVIVQLNIIHATGGDISYAFGGWEPPIGIEYRFDSLNLFFLLLLSFVTTVMVPYARQSIRKELQRSKQPLFYCVFLLCYAGLFGILSTNDIFNVYVFLEISSLATYTLIAMGGNRKSLTAALEYLILGTIGATFILIGIGLLYMVTGTLNIADMAMRLMEVRDGRILQAGLAFLTLGLMLKIALFPLHIWLTNAYSYAPSFISAFLSATATKVSLYVLLRVIFTLFGHEFSFAEIPLSIVLLPLALAGIIIGSTAAIFQNNVKRLLAFSSVAQMSYIVLGLSLATAPGLAAGLTHAANHAFAKGTLFLAVGVMFFYTKSVRIEHLGGIGKKMPLTMAAFLLAAFSLIGIPFTAGFVSKWFLIQALLVQGWWWAVVIVIIGSLLAVIYMWKIIEVAYFAKVNPLVSKVEEAPLGMLIPLWLLAITNLYFGLDTHLTFDAATAIANEVFLEGM